MNKLFISVVTAGVIGISQSAYAKETSAAQPVNLMPAITPAAPKPAPAASTTTAQPDQPKPETQVLRDGTKIEASDDDTVTIINPDGTRNIAPDGILTLKDQTTFEVIDGKRVDY